MNTAALNVWVRLYLGEIDVTVISDEVLDTLIDTMLASGIAEDDCQEKYYSVKLTLEWLIRKQAKDLATSCGSGSGGVTKRVEQIGKRKIEVQFSDASDATSLVGWDKLYDDLISDPTLIGCNPFPDAAANGGVIIGVSKDPYEMSSPFRDHLNYPRFNRKWDKY
ncbi:hypothetical protein VPHG_00123 [Vibrio phage 11895-B1]|uniref:hypothetical protein n=1 Tax=Vibrio phage 11895-B1 TaxID=754075 RepID=UPI0002C11EC5|nr:hypothetical protein VPHG_00123 [Vibrio phage 11895-B1]AGH32190.1 hypothetical protein VPHG_00123 [Vibrio phage 11895-B1]